MRVDGRDEDISVDEYAGLVADHVRASVRDALAHHGGGVVPDPAEVAASLGEIMVQLPDESPNELAHLLGPFWSSAKVRKALGDASRQLLAERRKSGALLGLKTSDSDIVYPVFQFRRRDGHIEVKPDLVPAMRILKQFDAWTVAVFLRTSAPELHGLTPLDWVRKELPSDALRDLARVVSREWVAGAA